MMILLWHGSRRSLFYAAAAAAARDGMSREKKLKSRETFFSKSKNPLVCFKHESHKRNENVDDTRGGGERHWVKHTIKHSA
jgi:hypothetical protein